MADLLVDTPPRPRRNAADVTMAACKRLLPEVMRWMGRDNSGRESVLKDLVRCFGNDGYAFARDLDERCGWSCDSELVDILDSGASYASAEHEEMVKAWVAQNSVTCPFALGDSVVARRLFGDEAGVIERIYTEKGQMVVRRPGDQPGCGMIVNYEDARLHVPEPVVAP